MTSKPVFCVAPMIDWTDRHCRYFHRLLAPSAMLYTEMITSAALKHGDAQRHLGHHVSEHPLALQLGGSDPEELAQAVATATKYNFDEYNINVGCPSDRVQSGSFGACLMAQPATVVDCYKAMQSETALPVTVKTRLGIDDYDSDDFLFQLLDPLVDAGMQRLILHARIAVLSGLSPKENRSVPPLNYPRVYRVSQRYPNLEIILNGGVTTLEACQEHLEIVDGVMIGREAYHNPWFLTKLEGAYGKAEQDIDRASVLLRYASYMDDEVARGASLATLTRPLLGLFNSMTGARRWRRFLSEHMRDTITPSELLTQAQAAMH